MHVELILFYSVQVHISWYDTLFVQTYKNGSVKMTNKLNAIKKKNSAQNMFYCTSAKNFIRLDN